MEVRNRSSKPKPVESLSGAQDSSFGKKRSSTANLGSVAAIAGIIAGMLFGIAIDKANLNMPYSLVKQMSFSNFTMMRLFLTAAATSTFWVAIAGAMGLLPLKPKPSTQIGFNLLGMTSYGANLAGGSILGFGMALSGACPGTIWTQVGAWPGVRVLYVLSGGLLGVISFAYLEKAVKKRDPNFMASIPDPNSNKKATQLLVEIVLLCGMTGCIFLCDYIFPWKTEMQAIVDGNVSSLEGFDTVWDPVHAGLVVGTLQLPALYFLGNPFGTSRAFVVAASYICSAVDRNWENNAPYFAKYRGDKAATYQVFFALGAMIGSYLSANWLRSSENVVKYRDEAILMQNESSFMDVVGGYFLLVGARLAGGCTSGHGLSGMALGSIASIVTVASMFFGGIVGSVLVYMFK
mmetsp:Transcript_17254/g.19625  ORF Transcript_17254/g.19625 Transcript_17254/m.19625 type:complete len:406 (-) Transcript_17254:102-1319(-)